MTTPFAPSEPTGHHVLELPPPTDLPAQRSPQPRRRRRRGYLIAGLAAAVLTAAGIGAATGRDTPADAESEVAAPNATTPATAIHGIARPTAPAPAVDADVRWAESMSGHTSLMNDAGYYTGRAGDAATAMDIPAMVTAATTAASKYDQLIDLGEEAPGADSELATKTIEAWRLFRDGMNLSAEGAVTLDVDTLHRATDLINRGTDLLHEATTMLRAKTN
jgi:hypothetical protein